MSIASLLQFCLTSFLRQTHENVTALVVGHCWFGDRKGIQAVEVLTPATAKGYSWKTSPDPVLPGVISGKIS